MPEIKPLKTIHQSFLELPEKIRDWLTSERATYTIIEMNKKLDLFGNLLTVIPNLITKLVTKNLDPKNFVKELGDGLGLDNEQAQEVTREIMEKILRPVDLPLKQVGVFIGLIYGMPSAAPTAPRPAVPLAQPSLGEARPTEVGRPTPPRPPAIPPTIPAAPVPPESIQSKIVPIPIKLPKPPDNKNIYGSPPAP